MRQRLIHAAVLTALAVPLFATSPALAARTSADLLRTQVVRLHSRLTRAALETPEVAEAHAAVARAFAELYQVRENILVELRAKDEYADLRLALWHQQQQLAGQHQEVPVKVANILATATDALSIRTRIGKMEVEALEASDEYVAARDELNALVAAERQIMSEAIDSVRSNPEFTSMCRQLATVQKSYRATRSH